jgi:hypothetical protein
MLTYNLICYFKHQKEQKLNKLIHYFIHIISKKSQTNKRRIVYYIICILILLYCDVYNKEYIIINSSCISNYVFLTELITLYPKSYSFNNMHVKYN